MVSPLDGCACTMYDTVQYQHVQVLCCAIHAFLIDEKLYNNAVLKYTGWAKSR
jgi:hypothetical protein